MKRFIDASTLRFVLAGFANTAVTYTLYLGLLNVLSYRWAFTLAFAAGILLSYLLNAAFVFRKPVALATFLRFPIVYVVQYLAGLLLLAFFVDAMGVPEWLAPALVLGITIPLTYWLARAVFASGSGE